MDDLISRQTAIDEAYEIIIDGQKFEVVQVETLIGLPSAESQWIPIKWHEITEEERERECYPKDWVTYIDCEMPCDEQEILVQTKEGYIRWDVCYEDGEFSLDSGWDWVEDIVAWMPLPPSYREDGK